MKKLEALGSVQNANSAVATEGDAEAPQRSERQLLCDPGFHWKLIHPKELKWALRKMLVNPPLTLPNAVTL